MLKSADEAAAAQRWPEAGSAYAAASSALQEVAGRCPELAPRARDVLSGLLARQEAVEAGLHRTVCLPSIDRAFALDNRAAAMQLEKKAWAEVETAFGQAEAAWGEAAGACKGDSREVAFRNKADSARARMRAATQSGQAACDPAHADAARMLEMAKAAWTDKQWDDAGLWYRKAEFAWGLAAGKCAGARRDLALKKKESAALDAHNATRCAPVWEEANALSSRFKALPASVRPEDKRLLHDQVELSWSRAAEACLGAPREKARAWADAFAKERGNAPLTVAPAPESSGGAQPETGTAVAPASAAVPAVAPVAAAAVVAVAGSHPGPAVVAAPATAIPVVSAVPPASVASLPSPLQAKGDSATPAPVPAAAPSIVPSAPPAGADGEVMTATVGNTTFSGRFRRDPSNTTLSGVGKVTWADGNVFTGTLVLGKSEGQGSMSWANGDRYEGEWKNDLQHGKGAMRYANGDRYEGDFVAGHPEGKGRYGFAASGDSYSGDIRHGQPEGQGTYTWKSGDRYDGQWKGGRKNGAGRYTWASGESQEGIYRDDQRISDPAPRVGN